MVKAGKKYILDTSLSRGTYAMAGAAGSANMATTMAPATIATSTASASVATASAPIYSGRRLDTSGMYEIHFNNTTRQWEPVPGTTAPATTAPVVTAAAPIYSGRQRHVSGLHDIHFNNSTRQWETVPGTMVPATAAAPTYSHRQRDLSGCTISMSTTPPVCGRGCRERDISITPTIQERYSILDMFAVTFD